MKQKKRENYRGRAPIIIRLKIFYLNSVFRRREKRKKRFTFHGGGGLMHACLKAGSCQRWEKAREESFFLDTIFHRPTILDGWNKL